MTIKFEAILKKEFYVHLVFWSLYILYPLLNYIGDPYAFLQWKTINSNTIFTIAFAYTCYYYLFSLKNKNRMAYLFLFTVVMTLLGTLFSEFLLKKMVHQIDNYSFWMHCLATLGDYFLVGLLFLSFYYIKKNHQLDKEKRIAEINSLKAQINPHFLLNTLNTLYSYALEHNEKTTDLILKLSDNFKYVLYEGQKSKVSVVKDLNHIKDFIGINELRWNDKIDIILKSNIDDENQQISALLIITFIENAIKYTSKLKGNHHKIEIEYLVNNNILTFSCKNAFNKNYILSEDWAKTGIGLKNVRRRLDLIYSNQYQLNITDENSVFNVHLILHL